MKKVIVGSIAPPKIEASQEALSKYFSIESCEGVSVQSGVSEQPKTLLEMMMGSRNRALRAISDDADISVGLESGYADLKGGVINFCVATLHIDNKTYQGLSPGFFVPQKLVDHIETNNVDMSQALYELGISGTKKIGYTQGYIGMMTKGASSRKEYMVQAIHMAMLHYHQTKVFTETFEK